MANMKRGTRRALAGFCLAALSVPAGAAPFAAAGPSSPATGNAEALQASAAGEVLGDAAADPGGAIYSPFSPAPGALAARPAARTQVALPTGGEAVGLVATTVTALIAAGVLVVLVRVLM
jgi:hypothetical protein